VSDVVQTKSKPATYADIEALPPNVVGEILFGNLNSHPRPAPRHSAAASRIGGLLGPPFDFGNGGPGGWIILDEPELHLDPHVVVPDLAGWRKERLAGRKDLAWFEEAPDWVCEVLSPSTRANDVGPKRQIYSEYGVHHLWYIDPISQTLEVFTRVEKQWLLGPVFLGQAKVSAPPFDAITFDLGLLWPFDPPNTES
jgi:Uma2 family endonuclease